MNLRIESKIGEEADSPSQLSPEPSVYQKVQGKHDIIPPLSDNQMFLDYNKRTEPMSYSNKIEDRRELLHAIEKGIYHLQDEDETKGDISLYPLNKLTTLRQVNHVDGRNIGLSSLKSNNRFNSVDFHMAKNINKIDNIYVKEDSTVNVNQIDNLLRKEDERSVDILGNGVSQSSRFIGRTKSQERYRNDEKEMMNDHSKILGRGHTITYNESNNHQNRVFKSAPHDNLSKNGYSNNISTTYNNNKQYISNKKGKGISPPNSILPDKNASLIEWNGLRFLVMDSPKDSNLELYIRTAQYYNVTDMVRFCETMYDKKDVEAAGIKVHEMSYDDGDFAPTEVINRFLNLVEEVFFKSNSRETSRSNWNNVISLAGLSSPQLSKKSYSSNALSNCQSSKTSSPLSHLSARSTSSHSMNFSSNSSNGKIGTLSNGIFNSFTSSMNLTNESMGNCTVSTLSSTDFSPPRLKLATSSGANILSATQKPCIAVHCVAGLGRAPVLVSLALIEYGFGDADRVVDFVRKKRKNAINMRQLQNIKDYRKRSHPNGCVCTIM